MRHKQRNASRTATLRYVAGGRVLPTLAMTAALSLSPLADATAQSRNFGMSTSQATTISQMEGLKITADNYTDYVTTDNVGDLTDTESLKKVFFIYNVGTGKFLSAGGYWGTHAALSDTPHPFWLQVKSENTTDQYAKYPAHEGETVNYSTTMSSFWNLSTVYVGSKEGVARSHAAYTKMQLTAADGTVTDLIPSLASDETATTFSPDGAAFTTNALTSPFADGGKLTVTMDLNNCHNPSQNTSNKAENILSVGDRIDIWGQDAKNDANNACNLHLYYYKNEPYTSNGTVKGNLEIEFVDKGWSDSRRIYTTIDGYDLTVELSKNGVSINGQMFYQGATVNYVDGMENKTAYFPVNSDGSYKADATGAIVADPTLTADTGKPFMYNGAIQAEYDGTNQKLFISSRIVKHDASYSNEGKFLAFSASTSGSDSDKGAFTDRAITANSDLGVSGPDNIEVVKKMSQWTFDYSPSQGGQNLFWMQLNMPFDSDGKYDSANGDVAYKLQTSPYYVVGEGSGLRNKYYNFDLYDSEDSSGTPTKTPTKMYEDESAGDMVDLFDKDEGDAKLMQWKIVSVYDYFLMANSIEAELKDPADMSFLIYDNEFLRDNGQLANWKTDDSLLSSDEEIAAGKAKLRIGVDEYYKPSTTSLYYYNSDGKQLGKEDSKDYNKELRTHSRYTGVCITNGGYGRMYQDVPVNSPGWYVVGCKGLTSVAAQVFAEVVENGKKATASLHSVAGNLAHYLLSSDESELYWPFDKNHPMYNSVVLMNDEFIKSYHKKDYQNLKNVWIYVDEAPATLRVGVEVMNGDGTATLADDTDEEELGDWTVFDQFKLQYGGQLTDQSYLVLDEDRTDLKYLDDAKVAYDSRTMCLKRTFKLNQWNSLILPVGLTSDQFHNTFGTDAKLAQLYQLTDTQVRFKTVSAETTDADASYTDGNGDKPAYWLMPNTPYIIKPTMAGDEPEYTTSLPQWSGDDAVTITVPKGHYKVPLVTLDSAHNPYYENEGGVHWDFDGKTTPVGGTSYKYLIQGENVSGNGTMTSYGLLCANHTVSGSTKTPVDGTYQLPYAWVVSGGDFVNVGKNGGASKGFRCFFTYEEPSSKAPQLVIDGVGDQATGIADIFANDVEAWRSVQPRCADAVYSLSGQMVRKGATTEGLDKGVYLVNGKKVIVK